MTASGSTSYSSTMISSVSAGRFSSLGLLSLIATLFIDGRLSWLGGVCAFVGTANIRAAMRSVKRYLVVIVFSFVFSILRWGQYVLYYFR